MERYGFAFYKGGRKADFKSIDIRGVAGGIGILLCVLSISIGTFTNTKDISSFYVLSSFQILLVFYFLAFICDEFFKLGKTLILILTFFLGLFFLFLIYNSLFSNQNFIVQTGIVSARGNEISTVYSVSALIYLALIAYVTFQSKDEDS